METIRNYKFGFSNIYRFHASIIFYIVFIILGFRIIDALSHVSGRWTAIVSVCVAIGLGGIVWWFYDYYKRKFKIIGHILSLSLLVFISIISIQLTKNALDLAGGKLNFEPFTLIVASANFGCMVSLLVIGLSLYKEDKVKTRGSNDTLVK